MKKILILLALTLGYNAQAQITMDPNFRETEQMTRPRVASSEAQSAALAARSFRNAGRVETFDCGCAYNTLESTRPIGDINRNQCSFTPRQSRAGRLMARWSRAVTLEQMSLGRQCSVGNIPECKSANQSGIECCQNHDKEFKQMMLDARNWIPLIDDIEEDRNQSRFAPSPQGRQIYGQCPLILDIQARSIETRSQYRGDIARIILYYNAVWGMPITRTYKENLERISDEDPVDEFEMIREQEINNLQLLPNPFISAPTQRR